MEEMIQNIQSLSDTLKILSHPKRLHILIRLLDGPKFVHELEEGCTVSQSQLSQFLAKMKEEWVVSCEKHWQFVSYSISDKKISNLILYLKSLYL